MRAGSGELGRGRSPGEQLCELEIRGEASETCLSGRLFWRGDTLAPGQQGLDERGVPRASPARRSVVRVTSAGFCRGCSSASREEAAVIAAIPGSVTEKRGEKTKLLLLAPGMAAGMGLNSELPCVVLALSACFSFPGEETQERARGGGGHGVGLGAVCSRLAPLGERAAVKVSGCTGCCAAGSLVPPVSSHPSDPSVVCAEHVR